MPTLNSNDVKVQLHLPDGSIRDVQACEVPNLVNNAIGEAMQELRLYRALCDGYTLDELRSMSLTFKAQIDVLRGRREEDASDPALAAMQFAIALDAHGCKDFLELWNEGEFDVLRREWPAAPDKVYIGADPLFVRKEAV